MSAPSGMVRVHGAGAGRDSAVYLSRELAARAMVVVWYIETNDGTLWMNDGWRPTGVPADRYVRDASQTSEGVATQWFEVGRMDRGETPSAIIPNADGSNLSKHSTGDALDSNAPTARDMRLRAEGAAMVGLGFPVPSETWHAEIVGAPQVDLTDWYRQADEVIGVPVAEKRRSAAEVMAEHGQENAQATVDASLAVGIPVWLGAAVIAKESNGRNVFGHDVGGAMYGAGEVTEERYREFRRLIGVGHTSNGVGPAQITWPGFFPEMERTGLRPWVPAENIRYGLHLIAGYLGGDFSDASIQRAGKAYNGASSYGDDLVRQAAIWRDRLANTTTTPTTPESPEEDDMLLIQVDEVGAQFLVTANGFKHVDGPMSQGIQAVTGRPARIVPFPHFWWTVVAINSLNEVDSALATKSKAQQTEGKVDAVTAAVTGIGEGVDEVRDRIRTVAGELGLLDQTPAESEA